MPEYTRLHALVLTSRVGFLDACEITRVCQCSTDFYKQFQHRSAWPHTLTCHNPSFEMYELCSKKPYLYHCAFDLIFTRTKLRLDDFCFFIYWSLISYPKLQHLQFRQIYPNVTDPGILSQETCKKLNVFRLKSLSVSHSQFLYARDLRRIPLITSLETLDISHCTQLNTSAILFAAEVPRLKTLICRGLVYVNWSSALKFVSENCHNLEVIDLRQSRDVCFCDLYPLSKVTTLKTVYVSCPPYEDKHAVQTILSGHIPNVEFIVEHD